MGGGGKVPGEEAPHSFTFLNHLGKGRDITGVLSESSRLSPFPGQRPPPHCQAPCPEQLSEGPDIGLVCENLFTLSHLLLHRTCPLFIKVTILLVKRSPCYRSTFKLIDGREKVGRGEGGWEGRRASSTPPSRDSSATRLL